MSKRLDVVCKEKLKTRAKAQDAIKEGRVSVNGKVILKNSFLVDDEDLIEIQEDENQYVSRAAHKLEVVFKEFHVDITNQIVLDIGASTGGFTDVCLRHDAKKVYALDVGHLQLDEKLDKDKRVIKMEGRNAKEIETNWFDDSIDFICMDVSFISCKTILKRIFNVLPVAHMVVLIKPQFECGPTYLNKQGVLKDKKIQKKIVDDVTNYVSTKYKKIKVIPSPITGRSGNQEYVLYAKDLR